jgi:hypothetical protein
MYIFKNFVNNIVPDTLLTSGAYLPLKAEGLGKVLKGIVWSFTFLQMIDDSKYVFEIDV